MTAAHTRWPADRFYWALLDAPQWRSAGPLPAGLRPAFEDEAPVAPQDLHAVAAPVAGGRLLVCAAPAALLRDLPAETRTLAPLALPPFAAGDADPALLNLLVGGHEPASFRRARVLKHLAAAATVLAVSALLCIGLLRRAAAQDALAARVGGEVASVTAAHGGATPEALALQLPGARARAEAAARLRPPRDAAAALGAVLQAWPDGGAARPQSLVLSEAGASINVTVEGDPAPFLAALRPPPGWTMEEPRLSAGGGLTRVHLILRPGDAAGARP